MARGIRYTRESQEKALRLLGESRANHSSETKALASVSQSLGMAPETLRRWRNRADRTVTAQSARDAQAAAELKRLRAEVAELRKANEILTTASACFAARLDPTRRWRPRASASIGAVSGSGRSAGRCRPGRTAVS